MNDLRAFLTALFPDPLPAGVTLLTRGIPVDRSRAPVSAFYASADALLDDRATLDRWNEDGRSIFFGVAPRDGRNGDKAHCLAVPALWADLDSTAWMKHDKSEAAVAALKPVLHATLSAFDTAPSIVIDSGGGLQAYWLLKDIPFRADGKWARPEWAALVRDVEGLLAGMQPALRSDEARLNFDSLMRLPSFFNPKYEHKPVARIVDLDVDRRYVLGDFARYAPTVKSAPATVFADGTEPPILRAFKERDLYIREASEEKHFVICPWSDEHSQDTGESSTAVFFDGDRAGFKCLHGHCAGRKVGDVCKFFGIEDAVTEAAPAPEDAIDAFVARLLVPDKKRRIIPTGLAAFDTLLAGGLYPGQVVCIAGVGGAGKSILTHQVLHYAARGGYPGLYCSLEMPIDDQLCRLFARIANKPVKLFSSLLYGETPVSDGDRLLMKWVAAPARGLPLAFRSDLRTLDSIADEIRRRPGHYRVLAVDQLQHMAPPAGTSGMTALETNSRGLVELAERFDLAVIAVSQINRPDAKGRGDASWRPNQWSLRGSEALYHDAARVLLLHRNDQEPKKLLVNVNKGRMGGADKATWHPFAFVGSTCTVREIESTRASINAALKAGEDDATGASPVTEAAA